MDDTDRALLDAWSRIAPKVRADRMEALRRAARPIDRPVRPWCLCIRASDTRLNPHTASMDRDACHSHLPHHLTLSSTLIKQLTRPALIPWPGIPWNHAADLLGRHPEAIRSWARRGILKSRRLKMAGPGLPRVKLWSEGLIDPNTDDARAPDPVWGSLWQHLHHDLPDNLHFQLHRAPILRPYRGHPRFRGWRFTCPGLDIQHPQPGRIYSASDPDAFTTPTPTCGRPTDRLFIPIKLRTLPDFFQLENPLASALPTQDSHDSGPRTSSFLPACHRCHRIRYFSLIDRNGWNTFITLISAGLLYGHEVPRPSSLHITRRRAYRPAPRATPRRDQVVSLLSEGLTNKAIASHLRIPITAVRAQLKLLYKRHHVHSRRELLTKLAPVLNRESRILNLKSAS